MGSLSPNRVPKETGEQGSLCSVPDFHNREKKQAARRIEHTSQEKIMATGLIGPLRDGLHKLLRKLLHQGSRECIGNNVRMVLHGWPGLFFASVISLLEFGDLGNLMVDMRSK